MFQVGYATEPGVIERGKFTIIPELPIRLWRSHFTHSLSTWFAGTNASYLARSSTFRVSICLPRVSPLSAPWTVLSIHD